MSSYIIIFNFSFQFFYSDGGYDIYQQQQQQQHHDMEMDRRLSLQQQMGGSGGLHQVHSSPNITSPSSNNSQPPHPVPQPPAAPAAPPAPPAAPPAPPGMQEMLKNNEN